VGIAGGYSETVANFDNRDTNGVIQTGHAAIFAGYTTKYWYLDGVFSYARRDIEMDRRVLAPVNALAQSGHNVDEFGFYMGGGISLIQNKKFLFGPVASLTYLSLDEEAYAETGGGVANMAFAENTTDSLRTLLGIRMAQRIDLSAKVSLIPEVHLGWANEWLDSEQAVTASFVGGGTGSVNIISRPLPDSSANVGMGLAMLMGDKISLSATYDADFGRSDFVTHMVNIDLDFNF